MRRRSSAIGTGGGVTRAPGSRRLGGRWGALLGAGVLAVAVLARAAAVPAPASADAQAGVAAQAGADAQAGVPARAEQPAAGGGTPAGGGTGGRGPGEERWFAPAAGVAAYTPKGPTHCYRQFNIDWSWINRQPERVNEFLSGADPAALAEFCRQTHIDGTVVMAVPHHGYCTYETKIGRKFPGMKGDWFGRTVEELHRRRIAAFAYVTLNWNWKYMREHEGAEFVRARRVADGGFDSGRICLNAPGYLELVEGYTREVLERYPVDGMRWDILNTLEGCRCEGCRRFYRERYGEDLGEWARAPAGRVWEFYIATTARAVERLRRLCKGIKPSVEVWQNHIQAEPPNDVNLARALDIAYNEYGDSFRLLFIRGVADKAGAINGLMNQLPADFAGDPAPLDRRQWRLCLALGGRCYSYYGHKRTDPRTVMPGPAMLGWHREQLGPLYAMVERIQPYLEGAVPVADVGIVFTEATRYRFPGFDRKAYVAALEAVTNAGLARGRPPEFVNALDLGAAGKDVGRFKVLVLPLTSGLSAEELGHLRGYAREGGTVLVAGDALRHDARGAEQVDFALAAEMGLSYAGTAAGGADLPVARVPGGGWPEAPAPATDARGAPADAPAVAAAVAAVRRVVRTKSSGGQAVLRTTVDGTLTPVLHVNRVGRGRVAFLASLDAPELTWRAVEWLAGPAPLEVEGRERGEGGEGGEARGAGRGEAGRGAGRGQAAAAAAPAAVLTRQRAAGRWVLHLIADGDYAVRLRGGGIAAARVVAAYPEGGWAWRLERTADGQRVHVTGPAGDRLLVLE